MLWIARYLVVLVGLVALVGCERKAVPFEVEDRPPQERGRAHAQDDADSHRGHGSEADDRWGTGFEDDDTFGSTDAFDRDDADGEPGPDGEMQDGAQDGDSWGTGFEDDDTFGDVDALSPDAADETFDGEDSAPG
jgi:hypothetical protein